ncbi:MAG: hypothetical protein CMC05_02770 [Flavobacteriaceae bacterium]|nr:hypothetical protein [Flavobacteriaceae bacterium]|tara:strand:- start:340 stop:948 length:609 start_codon:yes stop_codon:yes gene_type:complete
MPKKKSKKKNKKKSLNYKLFVIIGGIFHFTVYILLDVTLYNDTIFWWSITLCGLISGIYFINKMKLIHSDSYKKIEGANLKLYMFFICFFTIIGTSIVFGNVINGTILGLNYIGKSNDIYQHEYIIQKITHNKSNGRNGRKRKLFRRNNPKVYLDKDGESIGINLSEQYSPNKNYSQYKTIAFDLNRGLFGFEIINDYELKK